jgi:citrate lyase beta subunit
MTKQAPIRTRSWLFTPATRLERFAKASQVGADVAILDLEDAVAPRDKVRARTTALDYLAKNRGATAEDEVISRIIADMVPDGARWLTRVWCTLTPSSTAWS